MDLNPGLGSFQLCHQRGRQSLNLLEPYLSTGINPNLPVGCYESQRLCMHTPSPEPDKCLEHRKLLLSFPFSSLSFLSCVMGRTKLNSPAGGMGNYS